jgi:hypothetical protein
MIGFVQVISIALTIVAATWAIMKAPIASLKALKHLTSSSSSLFDDVDELTLSPAQLQQLKTAMWKELLVVELDVFGDLDSLGDE